MSGACQIDFYVLRDTAQSAERLACKLALMVWEQGHTALLLAGGTAQADRLDDLLWQIPPGRFVPHGQAGEAAGDPVTIGTPGDLDGAGGAVIINLSAEPVPLPARFPRVLEFVPAEARRRASARARFRHYRELGLHPASHEQPAD